MPPSSQLDKKSSDHTTSIKEMIPGLLNDKFKLHSYDGSSFKAKQNYKVANILETSTERFHCSTNGCKWTLCIKSTNDVTLTHFFVSAQLDKCTEPLKSGLFWILPNEPNLEDLKQYDDIPLSDLKSKYGIPNSERFESILSNLNNKKSKKSPKPNKGSSGVSQTPKTSSIPAWNLPSSGPIFCLGTQEGGAAASSSQQGVGGASSSQQGVSGVGTGAGASSSSQQQQQLSQQQPSQQQESNKQDKQGGEISDIALETSSVGSTAVGSSIPSSTTSVVKVGAQTSVDAVGTSSSSVVPKPKAKAPPLGLTPPTGINLLQSRKIAFPTLGTSANQNSSWNKIGGASNVLSFLPPNTNPQGPYYFETDAETKEAEVELAPWLEGKFIVIKFLDTHAQGLNTDVAMLGLFGFIGKHRKDTRALGNWMRRQVRHPIVHPSILSTLYSPSGWVCDGRDFPGGCRSGQTDFNQTSAQTVTFRNTLSGVDLCEKCAREPLMGCLSSDVAKIDVGDLVLHTKTPHDWNKDECYAIRLAAIRILSAVRRNWRYTLPFYLQAGFLKNILIVLLIEKNFFSTKFFIQIT